MSAFGGKRTLLPVHRHLLWPAPARNLLFNDKPFRASCSSSISAKPATARYASVEAFDVLTFPETVLATIS
jgi:hypothetical protein